MRSQLRVTEASDLRLEGLARCWCCCKRPKCMLGGC